jgi:hypothetical protein
MCAVKLVSELTVGSFLILPTRGASEASRRATAFIRYDIKNARAGKIEYAAHRLKELLPGDPLELLLADAGVLVPIPGHAPRLGSSLWVAERICRALLAEGIGTKCWALLSRTQKVARSSGHRSALERPDPQQHYDTLAVEAVLEDVPSILLVDDVVTRGSTLIGAATRLRGEFPRAEIRAFALARVDNNIDLDNVGSMARPAIETIHYDETTEQLVRE